MITSRRQFVVASGGALAANVLTMAHPFALHANPLGRPIGLQLYTVGEQLEKDFDGTLRQIAAIGYREVEMAGFSKKKPAEIKTSLDDAGLHCASVHLGFGGVEEALPYATLLGAKYVISSVTLPKPPDPAKFDLKAFLALLSTFTLDDYKQMAQRCNELGEQAKKAGLQFGYHNHNFEFKQLPAAPGSASTAPTLGYDELLRSTDPALVKFELDCGWMVAAGHDPVAYLTKFPSRYRLLHIKDFQPTAQPSISIEESSRPKPAELGRGHIDYKPVFAAAKHTEVEYYYVEQEPPFTDMPAMQAIKVNYDYLHAMD